MKRHLLILLMAFGLFSACESSDTNVSTEKKEPSKSDKKKNVKIADKIKDFKATEGLFTIYIKDNECYWLLSDADLEKQFIWICNNSNGVGSGLITGNMGYLRLVSFKKSFNNILVKQTQTDFVARPGRPEESSLDANFNSPILAELPIIAEEKGRHLVNISKLFTAHKFYATHLVEKVTQLKSTKKNGRLLKAKCFPKNIEFDFSRDFVGESKMLSELPHPDNHNMTIKFHFSISELKKSDYRARHEDFRVGYFRTVNKDISVPFSLDPMNRYINRWDLRKKFPGKATSEVVTPVTYWISNNTPHEIRHIMKEAVLEWNKAFEKIGLLNAVACKFQPADADWSVDDFRYNVIQWITSDNPRFSGMGPSKKNPITGEILRTQIRIDGEVFHGMDQMAAHLDPDKCQAAADAPDAMMWQHIFTTLNPKAEKKILFEQYIKKLVMHEVGHTLGLRHNFKSSSMIPFEKMHDKSYTSIHGLTGSVMDYVSANIHPDPKKQGHYYTPTLGQYDYWAIAYGYTPTNDKNNKEVLDKILEKQLSFGTDGDVNQDPLIQRYDFSSDAIAYDALRCEAVEKALKSLSHESSLSNLDGSRMRRYYRRLIRSLYLGVKIQQSYIAGQIYDRKKGMGNKDLLRWVDPTTEQKAMNRIFSHFKSSVRIQAWQKMLNQLPPLRVGTWHAESNDHLLDFNQMVRDLQQAVMNHSLSSTLMNRLLEHQHRGLEKDHLDQKTWLKNIDDLLFKAEKDYWGRMNIDIYLKTLIRLSKSSNLNAEGKYLVQAQLKYLETRFSTVNFLGDSTEAEAMRQSLLQVLNKYFELK